MWLKIRKQSEKMDRITPVKAVKVHHSVKNARDKVASHCEPYKWSTRWQRGLVTRQLRVRLLPPTWTNVFEYGRVIQLNPAPNASTCACTTNMAMSVSKIYSEPDCLPYPTSWRQPNRQHCPLKAEHKGATGGMVITTPAPPQEPAAAQKAGKVKQKAQTV